MSRAALLLLPPHVVPGEDAMMEEIEMTTATETSQQPTSPAADVLANIVPITAARGHRDTAAPTPGQRAYLTGLRADLLDAQHRLSLAQRRVDDRIAAVDQQIAALDTP